MTPTDYKTIRESIGTQGIVASLLGIARETLARRETGKATITTESQLAINFLAGGSAQEPAPAPEISEIDRLRQEITAIEQNPACYNNGGEGMTQSEHYRVYLDQYLDYLEAAYNEARLVLPVEVARFDQENATFTDREDRLTQFQQFLGDDDVATFERWDKEFNTTNTWKNPRELRPEARQSVAILRQRLAKLERSQG